MIKDKGYTASVFRFSGWGLIFEVRGSGFIIYGLGLGFRVCDLRFRVWGLGFMVTGSWFKVHGLALELGLKV